MLPLKFGAIGQGVSRHIGSGEYTEWADVALAGTLQVRNHSLTTGDLPVQVDQHMDIAHHWLE